MKIVLATGIYPPDIGGPATYVHALANELEKEHEIVVITYGASQNSKFNPLRQGYEGQEIQDSRFDELTVTSEARGNIIYVSKAGGPFLRWRRYAKVLQEHATDADIVYAFSSVSCGVPLSLAKLKKPKKVLRLGGDFCWERYTDRGGLKSLREWYGSKPHVQKVMASLLNTFDHIVFSTKFQEDIYNEFYSRLPSHSVIHNALPEGEVRHHEKHDPLRVLFMGRFVGFKNLPRLIRALAPLTNITLTLVGHGPMESVVRQLVVRFELQKRVRFMEPQHGGDKRKIFDEHDLLILPSVTEISPNVALEASATGLPVFLTEETGLENELAQRVRICALRTEEEITKALNECIEQYETYAQKAVSPLEHRSWQEVCKEHVELFEKLILG